MDIFSHGLYGGVAFGKRSRKDYWTAFLFGVGPDLFSFGIYFLLSVLGFSRFPEVQIMPPSYPEIPQYVHSFYNVTHSLIIYSVFLCILLALGKKHFAKLTLGWPLHILVDIPLHTRAFFPTPFLWPVSDFHVNGIPWGEPIIFIPNVLLIIGLYTYWYMKKKGLLKS